MKKNYNFEFNLSARKSANQIIIRNYTAFLMNYYIHR